MRRTRRSSLPRRWSFLFFPIDVDGAILSPLPNDCQEECPRGSLHPVEHLKHCAADAVYRGEILSDLSNAISSCFTHWAIAHGRRVKIFNRVGYKGRPRAAFNEERAK